MDEIEANFTSEFENKSIQLSDDIQDVFLNPHLHSQEPEQFWIDGVALVLVTTIGIFCNIFTISRLFSRHISSEYMQIIIVSIADLLVCLIIGLKRGLLVHLPAEMLIKVAPYLILYCTPIEMGFLTLSSLAFLVFICGRHLRLVEKHMYKCVNPMLFCVCISGLLASSKFFELESRMMTKEEIENELLETNATVNISQLILQEENMVIEHTDLFNHPTYSQLVRLLFNFMTSQVATIWVLPVVFLHSCKLNKIKKKQKLHRDVDLLTPMMTLMVMVFSAPYLVNFVAEIALYPPTTLMRRIAVLCLTIVASCKIIFYFLFDKSVARDLFQRNNHVLVPWR